MTRKVLVNDPTTEPRLRFAMIDWLTGKFQENQAHMRSVAYRILGSHGDADDALQETWIRLTGSDVEKIGNIRGWLTTVVSRICLDMLRSRKLRQTESLEEDHQTSPIANGRNPEEELLLADSMGPALLIILEHLAPTERVAFVLHDMFDLPFSDIASIIDRSEMATRQIASRARRRIRGVPGAPEDEKVKREIVSAFLAASRTGDFKALLQLLDPEVVLEADETAVDTSARNAAKGAPQYARKMSGAKTVAGLFDGKATAVQLAMIDDSFGATFVLNQTPLVAFTFTLHNGRITHIDVMMDRASLRESQITVIK